MASCATIGMYSSRESSMPSLTFSNPNFSNLRLKRYTCSSGRETRTDLNPSSFLSETKTSSIRRESLILPDSIIPAGIFFSP